MLNRRHSTTCTRFKRSVDDTINQYGATPSQNHSLKHIVDSFVDAGFEVAVMKEPVPDVIDLTL